MKLKSQLSMLALTAVLAAFPALAAGPVPDEPGEFYVYFDDNGNTVGRASMDCEGNLGGGGDTTENYYHGYFSCE